MLRLYQGSSYWYVVLVQYMRAREAWCNPTLRIQYLLGYRWWVVAPSVHTTQLAVDVATVGFGASLLLRAGAELQLPARAGE